MLSKQSFQQLMLLTSKDSDLCSSNDLIIDYTVCMICMNVS
jgi:hypothetical protein